MSPAPAENDHPRRNESQRSWGLWTEGYKSGTNCEAGGSVGEGFTVLIMPWIVTVHVSPLAMSLHRF